MGWYVAYLIICAVNGAICVLNNFHFGTWQFWFYAIAIGSSFAFGQAYERERG